MNKAISLFIVFCLYIFLLQAQIDYQPSITSVLEKAKKENKIIHIKYYNSECETCLRVAALLDQKPLETFYNTNFINYKINTKDINEEDKEFLKRTGVNLKSVPFLLFFDIDEKLLHYASAPVNTESLLQIAVNALTPEKRINHLETLYKEGDRSIKTLYDYCRFAHVIGDDTLINKLAEEIFDVFPKRDLNMADSYLITRNCVNTIDNEFFKHWVNNLDKLTGFESGVYTGKEVGLLSQILAKSIHGEESKQWDLEKIQTVKGYIRKMQMSDNPDLFFWQQESTLLVHEGDYNQAISLGENIIQSNPDNISSALYVTDYFVKLLEEHTQVLKLLAWLDNIKNIETSVQEKADMLYLYAKIHQKANKNIQFQDYYNQAQAHFQSNKLDMGKLEALKSKF